MKWLSHHIPKTAGTSLRDAYEQVYGTKAVRPLYQPEEIQTLYDHATLRVPSKSLIIHGHFRAMSNQKTLFPNAERIVWIRDPVERAWSMLGHMMSVQPEKEGYKRIISEFGENYRDNMLEVFDFYLTDPELAKMNKPYQNHFSDVPISDFAFVGRTHCYEEDLQRLSKMMGRSLPNLQKNVRDGGAGLPSNRTRYKRLLQNEYDIVESYL